MLNPLRILVVDDDDVDRKIIKRCLGATSIDTAVRETASAEECLEILQDTSVDCVLLDYRLPEMSGIDFLATLRELNPTAHPAVVMLTGSGNERLVVQAMRLGVQDYLVKDNLTPADLEAAILNAVEAMQSKRDETAQSQRLEELALVDTVAGIGNRNFFNMRLEHALTRARRQGDQIALLYMDLDRFKEINDTWGHAVGDCVLREVASRLKATARDADTVARLSGDEFAVIMETGVSSAGAQRLAARIKLALSEPIAVGDRLVSVGVSIGIALYPDDATDDESLIHTADVSMYEAKFGKRLDKDISARRAAK